ncbi:MAG: TldD/PmbA family protein [bacterium]|nr:TldD/PmbA family protein [bacterium]
MKNFAKSVVSKFPKNIEYGDVRVILENSERMMVKNGQVESISSSEDLGFGIRVLLNGSWGFASSFKMDSDSADNIMKQAIDIAKASSLAKSIHGVKLAGLKPVTGEYSTPYKEDPFKLSFEEKISLLLEADKILRKENVKISSSHLTFRRIYKIFASTEGSFIEQTVLVSGGGINAIAIKDGEMQNRSYGNYGTSGYEFVRELKLLENAPRVQKEACELLTAEPCPSGSNTIILDSEQLVLQVHESIGHAVELDRVFGTEASYAGTSFVTTEKLDKFKYGSEIVNITANAMTKDGLGTAGWDDEGVPAQVTPIIRNGIFVGYLSSRESASIIGRTSSGAMRADGWDRIPIIRMTNVNMEPGSWKLEDLIADTKDGLFLQSNKSWSIDDMRENFQFGTEYAQKIKNGKLCGAIKDATYTGYTPEFWGNCDGICNADYWQIHGVTNCGKGEPGQTMFVGHGTTPARFRNVKTGIFRKK